MRWGSINSNIHDFNTSFFFKGLSTFFVGFFLKVFFDLPVEPSIATAFVKREGVFSPEKTVGKSGGKSGGKCAKVCGFYGSLTQYFDCCSESRIQR